jgi:hypothetical protein
MGTKNVVSQSGTAEPAIASNVNIKDAFSTLDSSATNGPTSGTAVTKSTTLPLFGCRAWVNFDGTSVDGSNNCTIRASGNVSSVVRNSTGIYTITFATAMPDANYCVIATSTLHAGTSNAGVIVSVHNTSGTTPTQSTTSVKLACIGVSSPAEANVCQVTVSIFR